MKLFYGEKLVNKYNYSIDNKNLLFNNKKLMILSDSQHTYMEVDSKTRFIYWGKIYAVIENNNKSIKIDDSVGKNRLKKLLGKNKLKESIEKIEGDFVGCLIKNNNEITIFSDIYNKKDVFYSYNKDGLIASTSLKDVVSHGKKTYDQAAIANILMIYGMYAPKKHTIYKNVRRFGVGEYLEIKNDKFSIKNFQFSPSAFVEYSDKKLEEYSDILEDAIKIRTSKSCNWLYLSSGWDSTALLAFIVKILGKSSVKAVTGKLMYSDEARNTNRFEIERAKKFAEYYDVDFSVVPLDYTTEKGVERWKKIRPFLRDNHIYADNSCNFYYLSEYIGHRGSKNDAVFCGEISDGAHNLGFSQFTTVLEHPVLEFREYSDKMASYLFGPTFLRSILKGTYSKDAIYNFLRSRCSNYRFEDDEKLNQTEKKNKFISSFFIREARIPFYSIENTNVLTDAGKKLFDSEIKEDYFKECIKSLTPENVYSWILHLYNSFHWQGSTVKSIREVTKMNNLDLALPFWDKRIQQFLSKMPENWGRGLELRPTKYPLKWVIKNKIDYPSNLQVGPHSYLYDVNPNFSPKSELIYRSALRPYFLEVMKSYPFEDILNKSYFDLIYYKKLTNDYINGIEVTGKKLNNLYNLIWLCWIGWY